MNTNLSIYRCIVLLSSFHFSFFSLFSFFHETSCFFIRKHRRRTQRWRHVRETGILWRCQDWFKAWWKFLWNLFPSRPFYFVSLFIDEPGTTYQILNDGHTRAANFFHLVAQVLSLRARARAHTHTHTHTHTGDDKTRSLFLRKLELEFRLDVVTGR